MELPPRSGNFVPVTSGGQHECILNVGDCLQLWTGLHSARHRVHLNANSDGDLVPERFSIAYFGKPDRAALLAPLLATSDVDVHDGEEAINEKVSHMTAHEFQQMRIQGTY